MSSLRSLNWKVIVLLISSFFILAPMGILAEDEYLIVSIVDADYPPETYLHEDENYTGFTVNVIYQTVNPTSSPIAIPFLCAPFPFPYLRTNLIDKSLRVIHAFNVEWVAGEHLLLPGSRNESFKFSFLIENHVNDSFPLGTYEMWLDYTNCSSSPVLVVTEKMYIDVTETSVTYYFDYNNESRIVSSLQQTHYEESLFIFFSIFAVKVYKRWNHREK